MRTPRATKTDHFERSERHYGPVWYRVRALNNIEKLFVFIVFSSIWISGCHVGAPSWRQTERPRGLKAVWTIAAGLWCSGRILLGV